MIGFEWRALQCTSVASLPSSGSLFRLWFIFLFALRAALVFDLYLHQVLYAETAYVTTCSPGATPFTTCTMSSSRTPISTPRTWASRSGRLQARCCPCPPEPAAVPKSDHDGVLDRLGEDSNLNGGSRPEPLTRVRREHPYFGCRAVRIQGRADHGDLPPDVNGGVRGADRRAVAYLDYMELTCRDVRARDHPGDIHHGQERRAGLAISPA